jgi:hypothetical protein
MVMIPDSKRQPRPANDRLDKRRREEKALDDALADTFPASDPVSIEQPARRPKQREGEAKRGKKSPIDSSTEHQP